MEKFEFHIYDEAVEKCRIEIHDCDGTAGAKRKAVAFSKKTGGPVDIARAGDGDWDERYVVTTSAHFMPAIAEILLLKRSDSGAWDINHERLA